MLGIEGVSEGGVGWFEQLARYAATPVDFWDWDWRSRPELHNTIYSCPGDARIWRFPGWVSYGYNHSGAVSVPGLGLGGETVPVPPPLYYYRAVRENEVVSPSAMVAIGDALVLPREMHSFPRMIDHDFVDNLLSPWYTPAHMELGISTRFTHNADLHEPIRLKLKRRHGVRWNVLFCDGHVENLRWGEFSDVRRDEVLRHWNRDNLPNREEVQD